MEDQTGLTIQDGSGINLEDWCALEGNKILGVDDEPNIVRSLTFVLDREGYDVSAAGDGVQAMTMIRGSKPNLLILDVMMPNMDGYQVCQQVKSDPELSDIQIMMLTAKSGENDRLTGLSQGADDYVSKPFSPMQIVTRVKQMLG